MRLTGVLSAALMAVGLLAGGPVLANTCQAGKMMCPTGMPEGGYCECTSHGNTEGGTVIGKAPPRRPMKATAGGCGAHPDAPGCK